MGLGLFYQKLANVPQTRTLILLLMYISKVSLEAQSVIFEAISAEAVEKAVLNVNGAGGLTHIDADG